ncbi:MAG: ribonuclease P protein subunit [Candidatus Methanomethylophilaceae archaeon]|jgi:ribonuclease P protein subunit POP4|nr:ribonuclease P protein subunit [Candidatus Methanomethylophilaceae archaeon]MBO7205813.1 ribonuclease P protein subunit [Candidatus Methanomethylophilaceae archaeon]
MRGEFIGRQVAVKSRAYPLSGVVVDETKNTFTIESAGTVKMVPKRGCEFEFTYNGEQITIRGSEIQHRPEDRIKKVR